MSPSPPVGTLALCEPSGPPVRPASTTQYPDLATLNKRYEQFVLFDQEKAKFTAVRVRSSHWQDRPMANANYPQELIARHEYLYQQYEVLVSEHSRQRDWVLQWQHDKLQYEKAFKNMQRAVVRATSTQPCTPQCMLDAALETPADNPITG